MTTITRGLFSNSPCKRQAGQHHHPVTFGVTQTGPLYRRSLAIAEKALGPEHPDVATSLENYAALLRQTGRADEAETMEARAKAIRAKPK